MFLKAFKKLLFGYMNPFFIEYCESAIRFFNVDEIKFPGLEDGINFFNVFLLFKDLIFNVLFFILFHRIFFLLKLNIRGVLLVFNILLILYIIL